MEIKIVEISGFISCFNTLRRPYKKECRSYIDFKYSKDNMDFHFNSTCNISPLDISLLQRLIKNGDEHAKAVRLINVTIEIQAPLYWWSEMDTYEIGVINGCSESTMLTLKKEKLSDDCFEGTIGEFNLNGLQYLIDNDFEIDVIKNKLPSGYLQTRDINISYQTLRRIYIQRSNHKLKNWKEFCEFIEELPMSKELIIGKND